MSEHYCMYKDGMCELDIDEAYQQGKADGAREFAEWLEDNDFEFRCSGCKFKKECESESADSTNITCVEFILAEWQKGEKNDSI